MSIPIRQQLTHTTNQKNRALRHPYRTNFSAAAAAVVTAIVVAVVVTAIVVVAVAVAAVAVVVVVAAVAVVGDAREDNGAFFEQRL